MDFITTVFFMSAVLCVIFFLLGSVTGSYYGKKSIIDKLRASRKLSEEDIKLLE